MTRARDNAAVGEEFASSTKMIFNQTAAPTGWTKVTGSGNDTALRVTTGTVGTGGSVAFETAFASVTPTITMSNDAHTLAADEMPYHAHNFGNDTSGALYGAKNGDGNSYNAATTGWQGGDPQQSHTHDNTAASSAINLDVSYVDVIIATKD